MSGETTTQQPSSTTGTEGESAQPVLGSPASAETVAPPATATATPAVDPAKPAEQVPPPPAVTTDDAKAKADEAAKAAEAKKADEAKAAAEKVASEAKAAEAKAAFEKSWADFKPKLPAGYELHDAEWKSASEKLKAKGLTPEQAQAVVEIDAEREATRTAASSERLKVEREAWIGETSKRLGGDTKAITEATKAVNRALEKYGPKSLVPYLQATGFDAHPGLFELLQNVGNAMKDDSIAGGTPGAGVGEPTEEARLRLLYPSMFPKS